MAEQTWQAGTLQPEQINMLARHRHETWCNVGASKGHTSDWCQRQILGLDTEMITLLAPALEGLIAAHVAQALRETSWSIPMGPSPDPADYLQECAQVWDDKVQG